MANRLQLKRGNGTPGAILRAGEPAYDSSNGLLYVGLTTQTSDTNDGQLIGGKSYVERVDDIIRNQNGDIFVSGIATIATLELGTGGQGVQATIILDEDDFASNRDDAIPTQQSVKKYVDDFLTAGDGSLTITNLDASGYVQVGSGLTVNGGSATINTDLDVNGTSDFQGNAQFQANVDIDGSLDVAQGVNFQDTLTVAGDTDLNGALDVQGTTNLQDTLTVAGDTDLNAALDVQGTTNLQDTLTVAGDTDLNAALDVQGAVNLQSDLTVAGDSDLNGDLDVEGNVQVVGLTTLTGNVDINGEVDISTNINIGGNISVGGTVQFEGDFDINANIDIQNDLTVGGNIDANGSVDIAEDLIVQRNLEVTGLSTFKGNSEFEGEVVIQGNLTVTGAATSVNFEVRDVTIEDRLLELGTEQGGAPTAATTWDLGLALHYNDGTAKKSAIVWQDNTGFNLAAQITETPGAGGADPQITVGEFANLGVNGVYIGDVTTSSNLTINSEKDASLNELFIGGEIDTAGNLFAKFNSTTNQVDITNAAFDGGTY